MNSETRQIMLKYFDPGDLKTAVEASPGRVDLGGFSFRIDRQQQKLVLESACQGFDFLPDEKRGSDEATWEAVAFIKVRKLRSGSEVIAMARSGALYDESYFVKRGGGSPYVGYPQTCYGFSDCDKFSVLAGELKSQFGVARILDCGCATGVCVSALQKAGFDAYGVDVSPFAVSQAVCPNISLGDARKLPFDNAFFDLLISQDFMEHIHPEDMGDVLLEQRRVLKAGGRIVHFVPFYPDFPEPVQCDAHLCNADHNWWVKRLSSQPGFQLTYVPDDQNQWDYSMGVLPKYFQLLAV